MKYYRLISLIFVISVGCFGQQTYKKDADERIVSRGEFDLLVNNSIKILGTKELHQITDQEHVEIMYCLNTILVLGDYLTGGRYKDLTRLAEQKDYERQIAEIYSDWIPNKGMGYYFPKLKMELYGRPSEECFYQIKD